jgi:hypothetical protein
MANQASQTEAEVAHSGPAIHVNRAYVSVNGAIVRVAFTELESDNAEPSFRTAIVTSIENARAFARLILELTPEAEKPRTLADLGRM